MGRQGLHIRAPPQHRQERRLLERGVERPGRSGPARAVCARGARRHGFRPGRRNGGDGRAGSWHRDGAVRGGVAGGRQPADRRPRPFRSAVVARDRRRQGTRRPRTPGAQRALPPRTCRNHGDERRRHLAAYRPEERRSGGCTRKRVHRAGARQRRAGRPGGHRTVPGVQGRERCERARLSDAGRCVRRRPHAGRCKRHRVAAPRPGLRGA